MQNGRRRNRVGGATHVKALMNRIINSLFFSISATARFISALSYCSRSSVVDWTPVRWRSSSDEDRISPRRIAARSSHLKVAGQEWPGVGRCIVGRGVGRETMLCLRRPAARHDRPCAPPPPIRGQRLGWAASGAQDRGLLRAASTICSTVLRGAAELTSRCRFHSLHARYDAGTPSVHPGWVYAMRRSVGTVRTRVSGGVLTGQASLHTPL